MRLNSLLCRVPPVWLLVVVAVVLWGGEFLRRGLWEPDEARYAYVAREMNAGAHWFVPHVNGKVYPDKPPFLFWLINASSALTGGHINGVSARLPSLLGSILALWAMTRLLARWHSVAAAWRAMGILLTSFLFWQEGGWGRIDALLCGLIMMSVYCFAASLEGRQLRGEVLAYLFAGLAFFAKGPVGLMIPMGIFLVGTLAVGDAPRLKRWHWVWGPFLAASIPATWLLVAWLQHAPAHYFQDMFGVKLVGRVANAKGHNRPFMYFLWHFPLEFLPWSIFLPAAWFLSEARLKRRLVGWVVFVIALFSLFSCKRNIYILPAYPGAAMLIGAAWSDLTQRSRKVRMIYASIATGFCWLLTLALVAAFFVPHLPFSRVYLIPTAGVLMIGSIAMTRWTRREPLSNQWFTLFCGVFFVTQITVSTLIFPALNDRKMPRHAAEMIQAKLPPDTPVYLYKQQLAIVPFTADRPGRELYSLKALQEVLSNTPHALVVFKREEWQAVREEIGVSGIPMNFNMGHKQLVLVEFRAANP